MDPDVLVLGAGAAGLTAARCAAEGGARVLLVEANTRPALKVRLSGGGRCNVTHEGSPAAVLQAFPPAQRRFLQEGFHRWRPEDVRAFFHRHGVPTEARADGRIFPTGGPGSAADVVAVLVSTAEAAGVQMLWGTRITEIQPQQAGFLGLTEQGGRIKAPRWVLATGGASYPQTGSRGDALGWLEGLGLPVEPWRPALAPMLLKEPHPAWEGVALREGRLRLFQAPGRKRLAEVAGDLVFTRGGISGPSVLALSEAAARLKLETGGAWLSYARALEPPETCDAALCRLAAEQPHLGVRTWLARYLPDRLAETVRMELGLEEGARLKDLDRSRRLLLVQHVCDFPLGWLREVPLEKGEVAAGGLALRAVDPKTCRVRSQPALWVCGELLDIHGPVGGYNLQAAFSTGFLAGTSVSSASS